jgi:phytoene desaturase
MSKKIIVIGSGLAGMSCAAYLGKAGHRVTVIEKNSTYGGRLQTVSQQGYTFDSGPSWYWMPDIFDSFFEDFDKKTNDYYDLRRINPGYRVYFSEGEYFDLVENLDELKRNFGKIEKGGGRALQRYLDDAGEKYEVAVKKFMYKPSLSPLEYIHFDLIKRLGRLNLFRPISKHIRQHFSNQKIIQMLEFPSLLLGAKPSDTPALYSIMNYADIVLGTWYPSGGIRSVAKAIYQVAKSQGVDFFFNQPVKKISINGNKATEVVTDKSSYHADIIVANADYNHVEQTMLPKAYRNYSKSYWAKRTMSPSALIFYVALNKKLDLSHHTLFFDSDFKKHAREIYDHPKWPDEPLFYTSCVSKTDPKVAPENGEALFILIPVAPNLVDNEQTRKSYFQQVISRMELLINQDIKDHIVFSKSYAHRDFISDYNSFQGNAYGLANTLFQTAFLKPKIKNKKINNLYYTGQLTVPGPGMPPSIVSGKIVADQIKIETK